MCVFKFVLLALSCISVFNLDSSKYSKIDRGSTVCPGSPWTRYLNNCYLSEESQTASWKESNQFCKELGANLVSIHSAKEMSFLALMYNIENRYWTGLKRRSSTEYFWTDGTPVDFLKWGFGGTTHGLDASLDKHNIDIWSVFIHKEHMFDVNEERHHHPLCKFKLDIQEASTEYNVTEVLSKIIEKVDMNLINISKINNNIDTLEDRLNDSISTFQNLSFTISAFSQRVQELAKKFDNFIQNKTDIKVTPNLNTTNKADALVNTKDQHLSSMVIFVIVISMTIVANVICYIVLVKTRISTYILST